MSTVQHTTERAQNVNDVIAVEDIAPGMKRVTSFGGSYVVDARDGGCLCADKEYNEVPMCKHEWAAVLADRDDLPTPFITDDLQ